MTHLAHETMYRSATAMERFRELTVTVCGAGALGANLLESLARAGFTRLRVIDRDRVEERNLCTQPYGRSDIGAFKAELLSNDLYRAVGADVDAHRVELTERNAARRLVGSDLVVDTFDNTRSRALVQATAGELGIPCLHAGLATDYGEVDWDPGYRVPEARNADPCDYPLARTLAVLTATVAAELIATWAMDGERRSFTVTLRDLRVEPLRR